MYSFKWLLLQKTKNENTKNGRPNGKTKLCYPHILQNSNVEKFFTKLSKKTMHYCKWVKRTLHASCCVFRNKVFYFRVNLRICFVLLRKSQCFANGKYTQKSRFHGKSSFS